MIMQVTDILDTLGYKYSIWGESVLLNFHGKNAPNYQESVRCAVIDECVVATVSVAVPVTIPEGCVPSILDLIARINYYVRQGCFEFNHKNRQVHFRITSSHDEVIQSKVLEVALSLAINQVDQFFPAFASVIYANDEPEAAVRLNLKEPPSDEEE